MNGIDGCPIVQLPGCLANDPKTGRLTTSTSPAAVMIRDVRRNAVHKQAILRLDPTEYLLSLPALGNFPL
jgi:hypothetical protein